MKILVQAFLLIGLLTAGQITHAESAGKPADEAIYNGNTLDGYKSKNGDKSESATGVIAPATFCKECGEKASQAKILDNTNRAEDPATDGKVQAVEEKAGADSSKKGP